MPEAGAAPASPRQGGDGHGRAWQCGWKGPEASPCKAEPTGAGPLLPTSRLRREQGRESNRERKGEPGGKRRPGNEEGPEGEKGIRERKADRGEKRDQGEQREPGSQKKTKERKGDQGEKRGPGNLKGAKEWVCQS